MSTVDLFNNIFNTTNTSIVFFNKNKQLEYYNTLMEHTWDIPKNLLETGTGIIEFLEILRERQVYPIKDDFKDFCAKINGYFNQLNHPVINHLILSNGKNYEENIIPFNNGVIFIWENTTKLWETVYNLNGYKNLYNRIINNMPLPVLIVGSNGLIENFNVLFCNFFKISQSSINNDTHISTLLKQIQPLHNKEEITNYLIGLFLNRKDFSYNLLLLNGLMIEINGFTLPNGNNFIIFRNESTISPTLNFKEIKNNLKDLQENLILDLEKIINNPINTIIGFSDMLKEGYLGILNIKQQEYITKIITQAESIKNNLIYKTELTLYKDTEELPFEQVDINEIVVSVIQQIKNKLQERNIKINLTIENNTTYISTNNIALNKLFTLTLLYLIDQNSNNCNIDIIITSNPLTITFKDTSSVALFSPVELTNSFNLILVLKNLELLKGSYKVLSKNRSFRTLVFTFND